MKFTLRQLSYFIAAGDTGSITLASKRASISQPAISTAISHIERELGVQLFLRQHAQGLSLTPAGHLVLREAKQILKQAESLHTTASEISQQISGDLSVGWFITLAPIIMPALVQTFMKKFPGTQVSAVVGHQAVLLENLRRAEIDIAITYDLQISGDIAFEPLASLPPYALFGADHPLARAQSVTLAQLAPLPMVLLNLPMSREYFYSLFVREGLEPNVVRSSEHQEVVRTLVANGLGYALANVRPRSSEALDGRQIMRVPLAGNPPPVRIGIATPQQLRKTRLVEAFHQHCRESVSDINVPGMTNPPEPRRRKKH
jgi:DNA-binding transcriptional LysR family regulator